MQKEHYLDKFQYVCMFVCVYIHIKLLSWYMAIKLHLDVS